MTVGIFSHEDYANYGYEVGMALRAAGVNADSFVLRLHGFKYPHQSTQVSQEAMAKKVHDYDVIMVMHTCGTVWDMVKHIKDKPIIVWHTGTRYRSEPQKHNERWNPVATKHICALPEFMGLGCKDPEYFGITINTDRIQPMLKNRQKLTFGHFPSNPKVKGTPAIQKVIRRVLTDFVMKCGWICDMKKVSYDRQLLRMNTCDVYIEMLAPTQDGNKYGSFGTTALEAAALGKIVITNDCSSEVYKKAYGDHAMMIANSDGELYDVCKYLINLDKHQITELKKLTRKWVEEKHGRNAQGLRLLEIITRVYGQFKAGRCLPCGVES